MPVNYIFSLKHLSADFYSAYPISAFPEILQDSNRSYVMVLFQIANGHYVGTPFRTNMRHNNGYHFKNSQRSLKNRSGIDYSKSVIINDIKYIDNTTHAIIDKDEWKEFMANSNKIDYSGHNFTTVPDRVYHRSGQTLPLNATGKLYRNYKS